MLVSRQLGLAEFLLRKKEQNLQKLAQGPTWNQRGRLAAMQIYFHFIFMPTFRSVFSGHSKP